MQDELAIEIPGLVDADAETPVRKKRRSLRTAWKALDWETRGTIGATIFAVTVVGSIVLLVYGALAVWNHNGRVQAVERAKMMDGEVFAITDVSANFVGDTRLFLKNARGEDCGWVMIYMSNPLTEEVNPIFTLFNRKRPRYPMRVRAHYRSQPHALKGGKTIERYTGTFLDFELLDQPPGR
ncbi:MAG: hypothetical protein ACJ74Q_15660 [Pyrinomonadaceae bacterium]